MRSAHLTAIGSSQASRSVVGWGLYSVAAQGRYEDHRAAQHWAAEHPPPWSSVHKSLHLLERIYNRIQLHIATSFLGSKGASFGESTGALVERRRRQLSGPVAVSPSANATMIWCQRVHEMRRRLGSNVAN